MELITRQEAYGAGKKRFFTGKPCKRGHISERNVNTGACVACLAHYAKQYSHQKSGTMSHTVQVFHEHTDILESFASLLRRSKTVGGPVPLVPHFKDVETVNTFILMMNPGGKTEIVTQAAPAPLPQPAQAAPVVASGPDAKYEVWVRIHGKEVADQMRASGM